MPPPTEFKKLVAYCSEKKKRELPLGSDANAHYTLWDGSDVNPREDSLREYLMA